MDRERSRGGAGTRWIVAGALAAAGGVCGAWLWMRRARDDDASFGAEGVVDAGERRRRTGSVDDRGAGGYAIDVERLRQEGELEPAVEYLTYIQTRRGVAEHLLFVRHEDLDAIAALEGEEPDSFIERLQHLGVVISNN